MVPQTEGHLQAEPVTAPPVLARAAYGSHLVFDVPDR